MNLNYALIQVAVMAAVTFGIRALPFLLFPSGRKQPKIISYLSGVLPHAVIAMLVVYCLKDVSVTAAPHGLPEAISIAVTAGIHLWRRNTFLSLAVGTVLYMILIRTVFA